MARVYSTTVNNWSGTVGGMVFYMFRKKQCVRSLPSHYRDANTPVQRRNRKRFTLVAQVLAPLKEVLRIGFRYGFEGQTPWNAAAQANTLSAFPFDESRGEFVFRPERLLVSQGRIAQASCPVMMADGHRIIVSWASLAGRQSQHLKLDDRPMLTIYNADRRQVWHEVCPSRRDALLCETRIPDCWAGEQMWVYLSFLTNSEVPRVSTSQYLGTLNPPAIPHFLSHNSRSITSDPPVSLDPPSPQTPSNLVSNTAQTASAIIPNRPLKGLWYCADIERPPSVPQKSSLRHQPPD